MSLYKIGSRAMWRLFALFMAYYIFGPSYYLILDAFYAQAVAQGGTGLTTFIAWAYPAFYYGFPTIIVLGIVFVILGVYGQLRRKYYATEEVGYYGS